LHPPEVEATDNGRVGSPAHDDLPEAIARDIEVVSRLAAVPSILQVICQSTGMGFAAVARVTADSWTACAVRDEISFGLVPGSQLAVQTTLCSEVREVRMPVVIEHASQDSVYAQHHTPRIYGLESYISVPIVLESGEYFGNLCAIDRRPVSLPPQTRETIRLFAELIAGQIDDERRHQATDHALASERQTAELREQFIAVLGHDLRSPLASCAAIGELMLLSQDPTRITEFGERLLGSTRRMSALIDDVLDFARGRLGAGMALSVATVDRLGALMSDVVSELQVANPGWRIESDIRLDAPVVCDAGRVQQVLSNLVRNALVHGSKDSAVIVRAYTEEDRFAITVANGGTPIAPQDHERIFEPYARGTQRQGLGLGLYICRQIVEAHGGRISVASSTVDGTRFVAELPLVAAGSTKQSPGV
jgi:signal transduction histidine kinase